MKDKITLKEFFESKEKLAIHCDTEEKANKLLREFDKLGKKWLSEESYLQYNNFNDYNDKTCYSNYGEYCEIEFYKERDCKIYSFEEVIFEEEAKPKNLIPEIAKMLGVEIGERFKVDNVSGTFYFENYYLLEEGLNNFIFDNEQIRLNAILIELINGHWKITERLTKKPQLTKAEKVILENLPKEYKWIARNKYGELTVFESKPFKEGVIFWQGWHDGYTLSLKAFKHLFQFIKWEDDNAYKIEDLLKGELRWL